MKEHIINEQGEFRTKLSEVDRFWIPEESIEVSIRQLISYKRKLLDFKEIYIRDDGWKVACERGASDQAKKLYADTWTEHILFRPLVGKFTQEIKQKWLEALKSGKYEQGFMVLHREQSDTYCCIGVLGDIHPGLDNKADGHAAESPYTFLLDNGIEINPLYRTNDNEQYRAKCMAGEQKPDYSNVIPLIEKLPTTD